MALPKGYTQVYTGDGKGKTTASIGLAVRAAGAGLAVAMIQFMKGRPYAEIDAIKNIPGFEIFQHGRDAFVSKRDPDPVDLDLAREGLDHAHKIISAGKHDLVILDEINVALDFGLLPLAEVLEMLAKKPPHVELVLTGRYAPGEILDAADLVTDMREIKHFYKDGVKARRGIEH
jgi:cob(I)alamin adenosyltransferase